MLKLTDLPHRSIQIWAHTDTYMHTHTYIHTYTAIYTDVHTCTHTCTCIYTLVQTHTHTHIHAHTHTSTHRHTQNTHIHDCVHIYRYCRIVFTHLLFQIQWSKKPQDVKMKRLIYEFLSADGSPQSQSVTECYVQYWNRCKIVASVDMQYQ